MRLLARIALVLLLAGCAVEPFTVSPLTLRGSPHAPPPAASPMQGHVRLPSCGQCHR